jgi:hypothetical protein
MVASARAGVTTVPGAVDERGCLYVANEYIAARACPVPEFLAGLANGSLTTCNGTRVAAANWATRITKLCIRRRPYA